MKRIHPNANRAAALAALIVSVGAGCRNQSGAAMNLFLAPNRVPPPATRALQPGEARPYYPGDPLPVMQSGTTPNPDGSGLAWTSPGGSQTAMTNPSAARPLAFSNESMVAIPSDCDSLRFAVPAPAEPESFTPVAQLAAAPTPSTQAVIPASYTEPLMNPAIAPAPGSLWRSPQIAPAAALAPVVPAYSPASAPPFAAAPNTMDVQLRAVASPPAEPGMFASPRIRLPGYAAVPQSANASDGFRPRSSMR